jgi:hypothetical protein
LRTHDLERTKQVKYGKHLAMLATFAAGVFGADYVKAAYEKARGSVFKTSGDDGEEADDDDVDDNGGDNETGENNAIDDGGNDH